MGVLARFYARLCATQRKQLSNSQNDNSQKEYLDFLSWLDENNDTVSIEDLRVKVKSLLMLKLNLATDAKYVEVIEAVQRLNQDQSFLVSDDYSMYSFLSQFYQAIQCDDDTFVIKATLNINVKNREGQVHLSLYENDQTLTVGEAIRRSVMADESFIQKRKSRSMR